MMGQHSANQEHMNRILRVDRLLDLARQYCRFRHVVLAARHAGAPLFGAAGAGSVDANDFQFADQAAREARRTGLSVMRRSR